MRLKIVAAAAVLAIGAGVGLTVWMRSRTPVSAQEILREAVRAGESTLARSAEPLLEIFNQQASQGYYADAMATAHLWDADVPSRYGLVVDVIRTRAENGDVQGARKMAAKFDGAPTGIWATEAIASVQARRGDLRGALETSALLPSTGQARGCPATVRVGGIEVEHPLPGAVRAIEEFGAQQLKSGDLDGALNTAEQVRPCSTPALLSRIADTYFEQGKLRQAREMASQIANRKVAAEFLGMLDQRERVAARFSVVEPSPCDVARYDAQLGKFAEAYRLLEGTKCLVSDVAVKQYPSDPAAAEKALRTSSNREDLALGMAGFARAAARKGDVADALRLLTAAQVAGASDWPQTAVVRDVAWVWTLKEGPKSALRWARSRPTGSERASALLGVAQALAHPRPHPTP
jgi:tetratricopeptide (TPR) repeat protein